MSAVKDPTILSRILHRRMDGTHDRPLADLARAIRRSDAQAFAELYDALHPPLLRYAWSLTRDEEAGYDILQEAFLRLWKTRLRIDPDRSIEALLYRIVRNLAYKYNRRGKRHVSLLRMHQDHGAANHIAAELDADMLRERFADWVADMPARRREVFQLSRYSGLSHADISELLGISPKTVNNHLVAALRYLRDRLEACDPDRELP